MIEIDGKIIRNLQEQVYKNQQDIAEIKDVTYVISTYGLKIVGQIDDATELPDPSTYSGSYGDAYAVGTEEPFEYYVFTRPNDSIPYAHWFDIGQLAIAGPQGPEGPEGPQGPQGTRGSKWFADASNPLSISGYEVGDIWLNNLTFDIYILKSGTPNYWALQGNIQGPQGIQGNTGPQGATGQQGPQGIQGPKGDPAGLFNIKGTLSSSSLLPDATTLNVSDAYFVGVSAPYDLYIVIDNNGTNDWLNLGAVYSGAIVEIDGSQGSGVLNVSDYNILLANPYAVLKVFIEDDLYEYFYRTDDDASDDLTYTHIGGPTGTVISNLHVKDILIDASRNWTLTSRTIGSNKYLHKYECSPVLYGNPRATITIISDNDTQFADITAVKSACVNGTAKIIELYALTYTNNTFLLASGFSWKEPLLTNDYIFYWYQNGLNATATTTYDSGTGNYSTTIKFANYGGAAQRQSNWNSYSLTKVSIEKI